MKPNIQCRICGSKIKKFLDLGEQPLANSFPKSKDEIEAKYPLEVFWCEDCNLVQLGNVVDREEVFRDYIYFSSGMPKLSNHFKTYAEDVINRFLKKGGSVVELACNDGILLKHFKDKGYKVLGIDPAKNIRLVSEKLEIDVIVDFFSEDLAKSLPQTDVIIANNVVAHIDDHHDLARGIFKLLKDDGVFVLEAPYLMDMFENLTYDTIYHEHLSYLAVRPLKRLFEQYGLEIFEVQVNEIQGYSLRIFIGHKGKHEITPSVQRYINQELTMGLNKFETYEELAQRIIAQKVKLMNLLLDLKDGGKRIAAYGAPAKGNTVLNYCGIDNTILDYALEDLSNKQGLYTPGTYIPIVSSEYAHANEPDYYLMLAWNYRNAILEKEQEFRNRGGRFIIPVEGIKII